MSNLKKKLQCPCEMSRNQMLLFISFVIRAIIWLAKRMMWKVSRKCGKFYLDIRAGFEHLVLTKGFFGDAVKNRIFTL